MISPFSMLPIEVHSHVRRMLGEQTTQSNYWSQGEISRYVSDSYREICRETKALEFITLVSTTADQQEYTLPAEAIHIFRVSFDNRKVHNITKWELDRTEPDWENQTGYVSHYVTTQQRNRRFRLYKAPSVGAGLTVSGTDDLGVVIDIDDGENTYLFSTDLGVTADTSGGDWTTDFSSEYGEIIDIPSGDYNLEVWAVRLPPTWGLYNSTTGLYANFTEQMELPHWCQMAVAYRAAAKALRKYGEPGQAQAADAYDAIALDYVKLLKGHVANRSGERLMAMGSRPLRGQRRPQPWDTPIED